MVSASRETRSRAALRGRVGLLSLCLGWTLLLAGGASASVPVGFSEQSPAEVRQYWTPERMLAALPAEQLLGHRVAMDRSTSAAPARGGSVKRAAVRRTRRFPKRTHGKVFFSQGFLDYVCSATAVEAENRSLVWTAGHCVYEPGMLGGGFAENWMFVPAYKDGSAPFGEWPARRLYTTPGWRNAAFIGTLDDYDPRWDLGAAVVAPSDGRDLETAVGARRVAFNRSRDQIYRAFGYPAEQPPAEFDGETMFRCTSPYRGADKSLGSPSPMRISCDMTGGSSGGGWVTKRGRVLSVVSYGYAGDSDSLYGPYQGNAARELYQAAASR